jgi:hypothetical protein
LQEQTFIHEKEPSRNYRNVLSCIPIQSNSNPVELKSMLMGLFYRVGTISGVYWDPALTPALLTNKIYTIVAAIHALINLTINPLEA